MITEYSMFHKRVRYTCECCGYQTRWWDIKQLKRCGESVGSWLVFWDEIIHFDKGYKITGLAIGDEVFNFEEKEFAAAVANAPEGKMTWL